MRNFRELEIWREFINITKEVYLLLKLIPEEEKYGLISQIKRSSVSIPSNIAEGCAKKSDKEFARFLEISLGSSYELETQLILCREFQFIMDGDFLSIQSRLQIIQKKIASFIKHLNS